MNQEEFWRLRQAVVDAGYGSEIIWQESCYKPFDSKDFMREYIWVVLSAGMKNQVVQMIEQRIYNAHNNGEPLGSVFKHKGKVKAIEFMFENHERIFKEYQEAPNCLDYLESLPFIGKITKYHLAKNLGEDVVKPDRHLVRIARSYNTTPQALCEKLSKETGYMKATVDLILWRAANLGLIPSRKGEDDGKD
jgi:endonuclease III